MFDRQILLMQRVADQKFTLEHLIELMEEYKDDAGVAAMQEQMKGVRDIYDELEVKREAAQGKSASGRMVLGDNVSVIMTPESYKELEQAVETIRAGIVQPEDGTPVSN